MYIVFKLVENSQTDLKYFILLYLFLLIFNLFHIYWLQLNWYLFGFIVFFIYCFYYLFIIIINLYIYILFLNIYVIYYFVYLLFLWFFYYLVYYTLFSYTLFSKLWQKHQTWHTLILLWLPSIFFVFDIIIFHKNVYHFIYLDKKNSLHFFNNSIFIYVFISC